MTLTLSIIIIGQLLYSFYLRWKNFKLNETINNQHEIINKLIQDSDAPTYLKDMGNKISELMDSHKEKK